MPKENFRYEYSDATEVYLGLLHGIPENIKFPGDIIHKGTTYNKNGTHKICLNVHDAEAVIEYTPGHVQKFTCPDDKTLISLTADGEASLTKAKETLAHMVESSVMSWESGIFSDHYREQKNIGDKINN